MMHYKLLAIFVIFCAVGNTLATGTDCSGAPVQCCNSVQSVGNPTVSLLAGLLGILLPTTGQVGLTCSPINVIGVGGNSCTQQTACCTGTNNFSGLIVFGCSPISLNAGK